MNIIKLLLIGMLISYTAASQAIDSQFIVDPATSSISSGVTVDALISVTSFLGSDSLDLFDSETLSGSASGNIDTMLNGNLVFTDLEVEADPTGTLSDSGTLLGFPVSASVTLDSIKFDYDGPSPAFPLTATAMPDTRDFGPGSLPMLMTADVTVAVQIAGQEVTNLPDNFSGTVSIPVSGKVTVDMDGLPNRFIISIIGDPKSYPFTDAGTVSGASYSVDGLVTVEDFFLDLSGMSTEITATTFLDVPSSYWAFSYIETLAASGITTGCGLNIYCPENSVTRAQMAVFLERGINGSSFDPGPGVGNVFFDVPASYWAVGWIERLSADGITTGCGFGNYCPEDAVTREQMAVFLLRAKYGQDYAPPTPTGVFNDVVLSHWSAPWIEQLAIEGITTGCGPNIYCPKDSVTRAQMAVFLVRTFELE